MALIANAYLAPLDNPNILFPWVLLGFLFLAPLVDLRHPLRLRHLDLVVLLLVGVGPTLPYAFEARPPGTTPIVVLGLTYLAGRLIYVGLRPARGGGQFTSWLPVSWLVVLLLVVLGVRVGYLLDDRQIAFDVGVASVAGADRIGKGEELYGELEETGPYSDAGRLSYFDTYGPALYLFYVPFEQALPWGGGVIGEPGYDDPDAAHVAAIAFDLLTMVGLFVAGGLAGRGSNGRRLGLTLVYAWAAYPYTLFELRYSFNDTLVALLCLLAVLVAARPVARGVLAALAAATKFAPIVLTPLLARGTGRNRHASWLAFAAAWAVTLALVFAPFIPPGGIDELWDRTIGHQQARPAMSSIWSVVENPGWLQVLAQFAVGAIAVAFAFIPRRRSIVELAALGAGLLAAVELTMTYWFSAYLIWFAPLAFVAILGANRPTAQPTGPVP